MHPYSFYMEDLRSLLPIMNALAAFEAVASVQSVSEASRRLNISQPSLSRHIKVLEENLNTQLFDRIHSKIRLTAEGERLFDAVQGGLSGIRQVCSDLKSQAEFPVVSIHCGYGLAHFWFLKIYPGLQQAFPDFDIQLSVSQTETAADRLEADLSFVTGKPSGPDYRSDRIMQERIVLACSPEFLNRHGLTSDQLKPETICQLPLLHLGREEYGCIWFGDWFRAHGMDFELTPEVLLYHSYPLLIEAASEGRGICIAWPQLSGDHFATGRLISLPGTEMESENGYFLVSREKQHATERFSALHTFVLEKARELF